MGAHDPVAAPLAAGAQAGSRPRRAGRRSQTGSPATGAVTVVQRFSSDLRLNLHFHALVLDGVYARDNQTGKLRFF